MWEFGVKQTLKVDLNAESILFNTVKLKPRNVINFIILIAKSYMYSSRCLKKDYNIFEFERIVAECECCEYQNARKINKIEKHYKKWYQVEEWNPENAAHEYVIDMMLFN